MYVNVSQIADELNFARANMSLQKEAGVTAVQNIF
jgi:hypothetical protein